MRFLLFTIIGSMFFTGTAFAQMTSFSQKPFTDIPVNSAGYQAIEYLRTQNVIKGYLDGTFRPYTIINRAEFVEFAINPFILDTNGMGDCVRIHIPDKARNVFFSDVSKDAWYAENICFGKTKKIVDGYPDGTFHPADSINFVEAAKIISNIFSLNIAAYQTGEFWYRPYVQILSDLHAIPTSIKRLNQTLSRGEMAEIVYRLRVDSSQKASMGFDQESNVLFHRIPVAPAVTQPKPPVVPSAFSRPSRRSIIIEAERQNSLRMSKQ